MPHAPGGQMTDPSFDYWFPKRHTRSQADGVGLQAERFLVHVD
jgi:hypothetical protein